MVNTYNIGVIENDETWRWKDQGYQEKTVEEILDLVNQGLVLEDQVSKSDLQNMSNDRKVLALIKTQTIEHPNPRRDDLEQKLSNLQEQDSDLGSKINTLSGRVKETREELEGLKQQKQDLQERRDELLEQAQELRQKGNIQKAQELEGRAGAIQSNQIAQINTEIANTERELENLQQQLQKLREKHKDLKEDISNVKQDIEDLQPVTTTRDVLEDFILVCETEWETYIHGQYFPPNRTNPTRQIEGEGIKIVRMGAKAPKQIRGNNRREQNFWDDLYSNVKEQVFNNPGSSPDGEWYNRLIQKIQQRGAAGAAGVFTGPNWDWQFGPLTGTHEFPDSNDFIDKKNLECSDLNDLLMQQ